MVANTPDIEKSIGRQSSLPDDLDNTLERAPEENDDRDDRPPRSPRSTRSCRGECPKDHCDAPVRRHIVERDGTSVEYQSCAEGHFVRERLLDPDGYAHRFFKSIMGP